MKNLIKYIIMLFVVTSVTANTSKNNDKKIEELVLQMASNQNVNSVLKDALFYSYTNSVNLKDDVNSEKAELIRNGIIETLKFKIEKMETDFPLYKNLKIEEKNNVLTKIMDSSFSFGTFKDCIWQTAKQAAQCYGTVLVKRAVRLTFNICMASCFVLNVAALVSSGGTFSLSAATVVPAQTLICEEIALGVTAAGAAQCKVTLRDDIISCFLSEIPQ